MSMRHTAPINRHKGKLTTQPVGENHHFNPKFTPQKTSTELFLPDDSTLLSSAARSAKLPSPPHKA